MFELVLRDAQNLALMHDGKVIAHLATGQDEAKLRRTIEKIVAEKMILERMPDVRRRAQWAATQYAANVKIPEVT